MSGFQPRQFVLVCGSGDTGDGSEGHVCDGKSIPLNYTWYPGELSLKP